MPNIALCTCAALPNGDHDDVHLTEALTRQGATAEWVVWSSPTADWSRFDGVLIRSTWDYTHDWSGFLRWSEHVGSVSRLFNAPEIVATNGDKRYLQRLGAPMPETVWIDRGGSANLAALLGDRGWTRGFIKPQVGADSEGTLRFALDATGLETAQSHLNQLLQTNGAIIQPYLESVETLGEVSLICVDGKVAHGVRKIPVAGDYRVQDNHGARDVSWEPDPQAIVIAESVMSGTDALYARVDLLKHEGQWVLNELELIEPSLFFRRAPQTADLLATALLRRVGVR